MKDSELTENEKPEELGVVLVPNHIVLTTDERRQLFEVWAP